MNQFEVYKDVAVFIRKVYLRQIHQRSMSNHTENTPMDAQDRQALQILTSLITESDEEDMPPPITSSSRKRDTNLLIKFTKMPPIWKNRCMFFFWIWYEMI